MKDNDTETWKETTCYIYMKNVPKTEFDTFKSDITKKMLQNINYYLKRVELGLNLMLHWKFQKIITYENIYMMQIVMG